jgi:hypothetical protein
MGHERAEYRSNRIELRDRGGAGEELRLNDEPLSYRQLPDGRYFLDGYAYDWVDDPMELPRKLVDHRERAAQLGPATGDRTGSS